MLAFTLNQAVPLFNFHYPERGRKPSSTAESGTAFDAFNFHYPERGRKHLLLAQHQIGLNLGSISITPKGDGNNTSSRAAGSRTITFNFHYPERGRKLVSSVSFFFFLSLFNFHYPERGRKRVCILAVSRNIWVQFPLPRKGTETILILSIKA